ncbi:serendipity locus protein delta-like [Stomoxys calcitrans]|uniref:C2H2-type domain-containing protein n=1 Tax=Stomoxys calcitrans TaxID=35570 RepID=A0A1I8PPU0_STOCA|nr:serendipity locus protein delta-like [Stomoxys calcitrans]
MPLVICRLCATDCRNQKYKSLFDDFVVYEITTKYFDPMFLNDEHELTAVCIDCWSHIKAFHQFQQQSALASVYQKNMCSFCATSRKQIGLKENMVIFNVINKYFVNKMQNLSAICLPCWSQILDFHKFQITVFDVKKRLVKIELECEKEKHQLENVTGVHNDVKKTNFIVTEKAEESQIDRIGHQIVVKEEPELELIDVHPDHQFSSQEYEIQSKVSLRKNYQNGQSDKDRLHAFNSSRNCGHVYTVCDSSNDGDGDDDDDDDDEDCVLPKTYERRKTIPELDSIIAQWRPILECIHCGASCSTFTLLQKHFDANHPGKKCHITCCGCRFRTHYYIEEHMRYHMDPKIFQCEICGQINMTRLRLKRHKDYWHSKDLIPDTSTNDNNKIICPECGKTPKTLGAFKKHMHRHEAKRKIKCEVCDKGFRGRNDLRTHLATHSENRCPHCSVIFKYISRLTAHLARKHADQSISLPT